MDTELYPIRYCMLIQVCMQNEFPVTLATDTTIDSTREVDPP